MNRDRTNHRTTISGVVAAALCAIGQVACTHADSAPRPLTPIRVAQVQTVATGSETL